MADLAGFYTGDGETGPWGDLLEMIACGHPAWHQDAACKEHPECDFFAEDEAGVEAAQAICRTGCLAAQDCLAWAMASPVSLAGIWAGTTPADRAQLRMITSATGNKRRPRQLFVPRPALTRETDNDGRILPRRGHSVVTNDL
jgi:hypothetical protein